MTSSLLVVLTLLFCAAAHGVSFHPCTKSDGEIMYSNIPCDCFQFPDQSRVYNANFPLMGMPTAAQQERAIKQDASNAEKSREYAEIRRVEGEKKSVAAKWDRQIEDAKQHFLTEGLVAPLLMLKQQELERIDKELDQYRSPEEAALLNAKRARAKQNRKVVRAQLRQNRQERRSEEMERKIDDIADKLRVW
jgi:hypothetical protein